MELRFTALPEHVRTARLVVVSLARRTGVPEELVDEVRLAVDEACTLAVERGAAVGKDVVVDVEDGGPRGTRLLVSVRDIGQPDPPPNGREELAAVVTALEPAEAENGLPDGVELALLRGLVDDVVVRRWEDGDGTEIVLGWPRTPPPAGRSGTA